MMPSDITGHAVLDADPGSGSMPALRVRRGPVFTNLLLADEINRAPAKTQAALLEVMQEYQVTLEGADDRARASRSWCSRRRTRSRPRARIRCPRRSSTASCSRSRSAIRRTTTKSAIVVRDDRRARRGDQLPLDDGERSARGERACSRCRTSPPRVRVDERVIDYAVRLARATRGGRASPPARAARRDRAGARARAPSRCSPAATSSTPDDVKRVALPALRHRVLLAPDAQLEGRARRRAARRRCSRRSRRRGSESRCAEAACPRDPPTAPPSPSSRRSRRRAPSPCSRGSRRRRRRARARSRARALHRDRRARPVATRRAWRAAPLRWQRRLPPALAVGVRARASRQPRQRRDAALARRALRPLRPDPFDVDGLPVDGVVAASSSLTLALRRPAAPARPSALRARRAARAHPRPAASTCASPSATPRRCASIPNFAAVSRYAWLAGDRRLAEIGIKTLSDARRGHRLQAARRVPARRPGPRTSTGRRRCARPRRSCASTRTSATRCVVFLLDCGRRMRADEGSAGDAAATSTTP